MYLAVYELKRGSQYQKFPFKFISLYNSKAQYILTHSKYSLHYIIYDI